MKGGRMDGWMAENLGSVKTIKPVLCFEIFDNKDRLVCIEALTYSSLQSENLRPYFTVASKMKSYR